MDTPQLRTDLQEAADAAADHGDFKQAIDLYDQVLTICEENEDKLLKAILLIRRANCNSELSRYECALKDSNAAVRCLEEVRDTTESIESRRLAFFSSGQAAYSMRSFMKALVYFRIAHDLLPSENTARILRDVVARMEEEKTGSFNFEEMLKKLIQHPDEPDLNRASFITNTEIRTTATRGRALFAVRDFQLGDLILCEKAFAVVFENKDSSDQLIALQGQVVEMLKYSPAAKAEFYSLTDGEYSPPSYPGQYTHSAQIRQMVGLNAFEFTSISTWHGMEKEELHGHHNLDEGTVALYTRASLFNHSCVANVKRAHIGDMMIVRAMRPIKKGEELCISYVDTSMEFRHRKETFNKGWNFECSCKRCQADATLTEEQHDHRDHLVKEAEDFIISMYAEEKIIDSGDIEEAERFLRQLRSTFSNPAYKGLPNLPLIDLGRFLAEQYLRSDLLKAEQTTVMLFKDLGFAREDENGGLVLDLAGSRDMPEFSTGVALLAARLLHSEKVRAEKDIFVGLSKELYRTWYGTVYGFKEFADPHETGWLTDLEAPYRSNGGT